MNKYIDDEGIINLIVAIIEQAREDYNDNIIRCDFFEARRLADMDRRGLVGHILSWTVNDSDFLFKEVKRRTSL